MKTANSFVALAVLGLAACAAPTLDAQANAAQQQTQQAHPANAHQNHPVNKTPMAHASTTPVKHAVPKSNESHAAVTVKHPMTKPNGSRPILAVKHAEAKPNTSRPVIPVKHTEIKPNAPRRGVAVNHAEAKAHGMRPLSPSRGSKAHLMARTIRKPEARKPGRTAVAHKPAHPHVAVVQKPAVPKPAAAPAAQPPAVAVEPVISRRDPFAPLIQVSAGGRNTGEHLPPGVGGLVVATVRVDGTVEAPSGMLAVVSNADDRIYFVHVGDRLYDGDVEKISLDGVTFKENSKDAFGKPVDRMVTKRIYPNAGE